MRRGHDNGWLINPDNKQLVGINLGADFTAEHEWGTKRLKERFGIADCDISKFGLAKRQITKANEKELHFYADDKNALLVCESSWEWERNPEARRDYLLNKCSELTIYPPSRLFKSKDKKEKENADIATAWDEATFGIRVQGTKNISFLKYLYEQFATKNIAIWQGGGGLFGNAGLIIGIVDRVPADSAKIMADADEDYYKLQMASEKTGIKAKIDAINEKHHNETGRWGNDPFGYYALKPAWKNGACERKSAHPVMYWLNPQQQDKVNFGWFTVEDLEQWLQGEGPIPMKKEKTHERR